MAKTTNEQVIKAFISLVSKDGCKVSMVEIGANCCAGGVQASALYKRFQDKEALMVQAIETLADKALSVVEQRFVCQVYFSEYASKLFSNGVKKYTVQECLKKEAKRV
jgi:AcrR family transcriptional regulator